MGFFDYVLAIILGICDVFFKKDGSGVILVFILVFIIILVRQAFFPKKSKTDETDDLDNLMDDMYHLSESQDLSPNYKIIGIEIHRPPEKPKKFLKP